MILVIDIRLRDVCSVVTPCTQIHVGSACIRGILKKEVLNAGLDKEVADAGVNINQ